MLLPMTAIVSICCVLGSEVDVVIAGRGRAPDERLAALAFAWNHIDGARSIVIANGLRGDRCGRSHSHAGDARGRKDVSASDVFAFARRERGQSRHSARPLI
ncbi:hypothetical protein [Burkholderia thailandensis]|uniref:hypothetical protein n=1 Tax=Burkholderia thailandensis TaxID=57975 RepID=UPI0012B604B8|nr:hypothetical protein [Burkholderia thailandensis]MBS2130488.1 hypothetical protein [Burkholderia thailandensis]MCS6469989.1 hypothetical protein [Burkholderia thailandensis]MCS6494063.1 hypothetical protein [Burkholderia thailandensis]MCS6499556.1 hypothetical protein [Burkholderia thailandensis]MCS6506655.1 hypothetical protein [Burkholderia thailandensis]